MKDPLSITHPEIAAQWHPTKNGDKTPEDVTPGSNKKVWWCCPSGHEWLASPNYRTNGRGCPACSGKLATPTTSLRALHPYIAEQWHPTKNDPLTPDDVVPGSCRKVWWKCPKSPDHEWETTVDNRTRMRSGCPCCSGRKASVSNSLATLFPTIAAQWHPTKNEGLTPEGIPAGSHKKIWWQCPLSADHEWQATVKDRTASNGATGCPCCAGQKASVTNSLASLYPLIAAEWHSTKNEGLTPDQIVAGSNKQFWWQCPKAPDHEWQATASNRTNNHSGCPSCARQKVSVTNSLASLFPETASEWHPTKNGELKPDQVIAGSERKVWWRCSKEPVHEWQSTPGSRTDKRGGAGCP